MKIVNEMVFIEDKDTTIEIKSLFKDIEKKDKELSDAEFRSTNSLAVKNVLKEINNLKFLSLTNDEINTMKSLLEKEKNNIENEGNVFFTFKMTAFISLVDYLIRNKDLFPHEFSYDKIDFNDDYHGVFNGEFKEELFEVQAIFGSNPISFFMPNRQEGSKKMPMINFNKSLGYNMKIISKNFLGDLDEKEFNEYVDNYIDFKKQLECKNKVKIK